MRERLSIDVAQMKLKRKGTFYESALIAANVDHPVSVVQNIRVNATYNPLTTRVRHVRPWGPYPGRIDFLPVE